MAQVDLAAACSTSRDKGGSRKRSSEVIEDLSDHVDQPPRIGPGARGGRPSLLETSGGPSPPSPAPILRQTSRCRPLDMPRAGLASGQEAEKPVLCIAGRSFLDEAAAALFAQILEKHGIEAKVETRRGAGSGRISRLSTDGARIVCLSYLDADLSTAGARYRGSASAPAPRRDQNSSPVSGRPILDKRASFAAETKADFCATRFKDALAILSPRGGRIGEGHPGQDQREACGVVTCI